MIDQVQWTKEVEMQTVNIQEAKTQLSRLIEQAVHGGPL